MVAGLATPWHGYAVKDVKSRHVTPRHVPPLPSRPQRVKSHIISSALVALQDERVRDVKMKQLERKIRNSMICCYPMQRPVRECLTPYDCFAHVIYQIDTFKITKQLWCSDIRSNMLESDTHTDEKGNSFCACAKHHTTCSGRNTKIDAKTTSVMTIKLLKWQLVFADSLCMTITSPEYGQQ